MGAPNRSVAWSSVVFDTSWIWYERVAASHEESTEHGALSWDSGVRSDRSPYVDIILVREDVASASV